MKTRELVLLFTMIFVILFSLKSFSQFEQKFTFQASGGLVKPFGDVGDEFSSGLSLDAGAQYNYNRSLAFVGLIKFVTLYPQEENQNYELKSIGIGICPKYRLLVDKKINPFIFGGLGLYFTKYSEFDSNTDEWIDSNFPTKLGYTFGAGVDVSITDHIALFLQSGYNSTKLKDEDYNVVFNSLYFQVGINISFLKSKSL